jgi:hypothetical protein
MDGALVDVRGWLGTDIELVTGATLTMLRRQERAFWGLFSE